jgi:hypothetical protein
MQTQTRYILVETAISIFINVLISALFMALVFGKLDRIELWGPHGLALDFAPQTFMISLMSVLIPTAIARRRLRMRRIAGYSGVQGIDWLRNMWWRALFIAFSLTVTLGAVSVGVVAVIWKGPVGFWTAFPFKLLYGALVALIATSMALRIALSQDEANVRSIQ